MAIKPSSMFKTISEFFVKSAVLGSHVNSALDFLSVFKGGDPSPNAPASVKGLHGVLGYADERTFEVLLHKLEKDNPGSRAVLAGFLSWHYKNRTFTERTLTWWYGNAFRGFIGKMGSSEGQPEGTEETTVITRDQATHKTTKVVTKRELRGAGTNNALNFLKMMVDTINGEATKEAGYERLIKEFESFSYPHIPASTVHTAKKVQRTIRKIDREFGKYADRVEQENANRKAGPRPWLRKLID